MLPGACARYHAAPLADRPALVASVADLRHEGVAPGGPLSVDDVAVLAVQNDPDLRAARARHGIATAQLLQAGLLPNPQIAPAYAANLYAPAATTTAWSFALSIDLRAILTRPARERSAKAGVAQVDAQVLWQEWQVAGQARLLAVDLIEQRRQRDLLVRARDLLTGRAARGQRALAQGNATLATVAPDMDAAEGARIALAALDRQMLAERHTLNALLGLAPDVALPLASQAVVPPLDPQAVRRTLPALARHRPDLVALRYGYQAQEEKVRAAIIGQFPNLLLGIAYGRDNTNDYSIGPQPSGDIPIFDRNQGNIAIERATRAQLRADYAARLSAADGEVRARLAELGQLGAQREAAARALPALTRAAAQAMAARAAGLIDERTAVDLTTTELARRRDIVALDQAILEQEVGLATLTGAGLPALVTPPAPADADAGGAS